MCSLDFRGLQSAGDVACRLLAQLDEREFDGSSQESLLTLMSGLSENGELLSRMTGISGKYVGKKTPAMFIRNLERM